MAVYTPLTITLLRLLQKPSISIYVQPEYICTLHCIEESVSIVTQTWHDILVFVQTIIYPTSHDFNTRIVLRATNSNPSGHEMTFANTMFSSAKSYSFISVLNAAQADPPVASIGSSSNTCISFTPFGNLVQLCTASLSALLSFLCIHIFPTRTEGAISRTHSNNESPALTIDTAHTPSGFVSRMDKWPL